MTSTLVDEPNKRNFSIKELSVNPEYASLVPQISDSEYEALKNDIRDNGQEYDILVNKKGEILDGHNRYRACQELGLEANTRLCREELDDPLFAKAFIIRIQKRRNLNDFQKGELYYKLEQLKTEIAARRRQTATLPIHGQKGFQPVSVSPDTNVEKSPKEIFQEFEEHLNKDPVAKTKEKVYVDEEEEEFIRSEPERQKVRTRDLIAQKSGLAPATYSRIKKLIEQAPEDVKEKLRQGKSRIFKEHKKLMFEENRQRLLAEAKHLEIPNTENVRLIHGDCIEVCKEIPDASVDLILTDPLYAHDKLSMPMTNSIYMENSQR